MWYKRFLLILVVLALMSSWLQASVVPGRWEKVGTLKPGSTIVVTLDTGDILQGEFATLGEVSIRMVVNGQVGKDRTPLLPRKVPVFSERPKQI